MKTYFDGAIMAYEDCAELMTKLADELPGEVKFISPHLKNISQVFLLKAEQVRTGLKILHEDTGMMQ